MGWSALLLLALVAATQGQVRETCLSVDEEPYLLYGSKTAYLFANALGLPSNRVQEVPGCKPIAFWLLARHGSHNPEAAEISKLQELETLKNNILGNYRDLPRQPLHNMQQRLCAADLSLLGSWQWNPRHNASFAGDLTSDGYLSTQQLAQAWKHRFPDLLTADPRSYIFKYVNDKRSDTSFRAFTEGLFGAQAEGYDLPKENDEKLLQPYKSCSAWSNEVGNNNETLKQRVIFESKAEFREMIHNVSQRLGFSYDMEKEFIYRMYEMCRYNKAWDNSLISPWCAAFTKQELQLLEYAEDLETYYKFGYGKKMNQQLGCSPVKDMMNFFNNHVDHDTPQKPKASIQLTDAAMMLLTLSTLQTHQDYGILTGDNYHTNPVQARKWTTSTMAPFNANIAAILYRCTPYGNFQVKEQHQVLFLENEKPMYLEGCRVGLCDWSYVKSKYGDLASKCDLGFCNAATKINSFVALTATLVVFCFRSVL